MAFAGFPEEGLDFFRELAENNNMEWFKAHKDRYQKTVLEPSREFVTAMGARLRGLAPDLTADPRINKSLFRLNRDTRFSRDKTPYKDHAGIWFWEGPGKRMECSGFYFHLAPDQMVLGVGIYLFPRQLLEPYRKSVDDPATGSRLESILARIGKAGAYNIGGRKYKRIPRGFPADHPRAELLKHQSLHAGLETEPWPELHTPDLIDRCFEAYREIAPLHCWLKEMTLRASGPGS